jgi:hypothetical protein
LTFRIFIFFELKLLLFTVKITELLAPLLSMFPSFAQAPMGS